MAYSYTTFKKHIRSLFGHGQSNVSGDGGGNVKDHAARLSQRMFQKTIPARLKASTDAGVANVGFAQTGSVSKTQPMLESAICTMEEECDLRSVRVQVDRALHVSVTDYMTFKFMKRKSPTFSVTEVVASLACTTANLTTDVPIHGSFAVTVNSTATAIDFDPGDTLTLSIAKAGAGALTPPMTVMVTVEEK